MRALLALALLISVPVQAQDRADDSRFLTLRYEDGGLFHIPTSPDTTQTVLLASGEIIKSVIVSDPNAYVITVSGTADSLTLRPNGRIAMAIVSVRTEKRSYEFELVTDNANMAPTVVRFAYGPASRREPARPAALPQESTSTYRMGGSKSLRPAKITDDGTKTYIAWEHDQVMPAIFAVGPSGTEEMVDGYIRDGVFTIDRVNRELVFRIDREAATAKRQIKKVRRKRGDT